MKVVNGLLEWLDAVHAHVNECDGTHSYRWFEDRWGGHDWYVCNGKRLFRFNSKV